MVRRGGAEFAIGYEILELVEPELIVLRSDPMPEVGMHEPMIVRVEFFDHGAKTRITLSDSPYPCVLPFWAEIGRLAAEHEVDVCLEPMGGDAVYNLGTFHRLREHAGARILCHVEPSQLWWQGIDVLELVAAVWGEIGFAHAKDVTVDAATLRLEGWLTSCAYDDWDARSWSMRAIGNGHGECFWREYSSPCGGRGTTTAWRLSPGAVHDRRGRPASLSVETVRAAMPRDPAPSGNWYAMYGA
jgi:hypothetical protein